MMMMVLLLLLPGLSVLEMMRDNASVRIFDPLAEHEHLGKRRSSGPPTDTDKLSLQRDYRPPAVLDRDLFRSCGLLTDYQWTLLSSANTGTPLHVDPAFTNGWNTVLSGRKMWVVLPPDAEIEPLMCDPRCAEAVADLTPLAWFTHVLPQLRGRRWYGRTLVELVQVDY